jgi:hypothetical protein
MNKASTVWRPVVTSKAEALAALKTLAEDFSLLASGDWVPDDDSCDASLDVVEALREWVEKSEG